MRALLPSNKPIRRKIALLLAATALLAGGLALLSACSSGTPVAPVTQTATSKAQQSTSPTAQSTKASSSKVTPTATNTATPQSKGASTPEKAATVGPTATAPGLAPTPVQKAVARPTQAPAAQSPLGVPVPTNRLQKNQGGNVTVDVTWEANQASSDSLRFAVVMDTHSVDLDKYDLSRLATLRTDKGRQVTPTAWDGPPGGGHHRSGALVFPATEGSKRLIDAEAKYVELIIRDVANIKERVLRWNLEVNQ